jgi:hypothetical protein
VRLRAAPVGFAFLELSIPLAGKLGPLFDDVAKVFEALSSKRVVHELSDSADERTVDTIFTGVDEVLTTHGELEALAVDEDVEVLPFAAVAGNFFVGVSDGKVIAAEEDTLEALFDASIADDVSIRTHDRSGYLRERERLSAFVFHVELEWLEDVHEVIGIHLSAGLPRQRLGEKVSVNDVDALRAVHVMANNFNLEFSGAVAEQFLRAARHRVPSQVVDDAFDGKQWRLRVDWNPRDLYTRPVFER